VDFLGIGAQKAATSWLHEQLSAHPRIRFPGGKELHFWDRREARPASAWLSVFAGAEPGVRQGEITPAYALLEESVIREIASLAPDLRVFYSLRNPMERAWSSALMALERAELLEAEVSDQWFVDHFRSRGSLDRGDYEATLRRWRGTFAGDRVLMLFHEEIQRDPRDVLCRLAAHLDVEADFYRARSEEELRRRVLVGPAVPIRPSLRAVLHQLYRQRIDSLETYLKRDLSEWRALGGGEGP
jgi:hypothetical protein